MPSMSMPMVSFTLHHVLTSWLWSPFPLVMLGVLAGLAYWYLRAGWILATRGRRWPASRTASFMVGLLTVEVALQSPVATFTSNQFVSHIVQHLMLMVVAPVFLALSAPSTLFLQTANRKSKI
ncbi:MAG: cytochrome c oxidase assembly protein, partial [Acidimicrobiales bacterium]